MNFEKRLASIRKLLTEQSLDALLITSVPHIIYLTGYAGFSYNEREAYIIITKNNQFILTDGRYKESVITHIKDFALLEISSTANIEILMETVAMDYQLKKVGFEEHSITIFEFTKFSKVIPEMMPLDLSSLRIIKEVGEKDAIKTSSQIADDAFNFLLGKIRPGISEKELALEFEYYVKKKGGTLSFDTIVAFDANASVPHHLTSDKKLAKKSLILIDFGVKYNNYCSDCTRTIFLTKPDNTSKKIWNTVFESQQKAIEYLELSNANGLPGNKLISASVVDKVSRKYITDKGYPSIPHSLGHGTGIEIHEQPRLGPNSKDQLVYGMVFSIEPGIYIPGWGGIRIEDLVYLGKNSIEILTNAPKEMLVL